MKVQRFITVPTPAEAVLWDGTEETAPAIIAWVESKGESARLQRKGEPSAYQPYGLPPRFNHENYIAIGRDDHDTYLNAQKSAPWIVWDPSRRTDEGGDFDLCTSGNIAVRYQPSPDPLLRMDPPVTDGCGHNRRQEG
jgi:hypothetical protein